MTLIQFTEGVIYRGRATSGGSNTLADTAIPDTYITDIWNDEVLFIYAGTGAGQSKKINTYDQPTHTFTLYDNWTTQPDATSLYQVVPGTESSGAGGGDATIANQTTIIADVGTVDGKVDDIEGVLFDPNADNLHALKTELDEILDLARTFPPGGISVGAAETNLFIDEYAAPTKILSGVSTKIDTSNMLVGDTFEFREYYQIESGAWLQTGNAISISGAQTDPLKIIHLETYFYGCKVTAKKTAGTDRVFKVETIREA